MTSTSTIGQPVALGGSSLAENLQHLPASMNLAKGKLSHEEALKNVEGYEIGPKANQPISARSVLALCASSIHKRHLSY